MGKRMSKEFAGLTAAVTGAGSGIGLATAKILADGGAKVYGLDIAEGGLAGVGEVELLARGRAFGLVDRQFTGRRVLADRHHQLHFVVQLLGQGGITQRVVGPDECAVGL